MKKPIAIAIALLGSGALAAPYVYPAKWSATPSAQARRGGTYRSYTIQDYKSFNPFLVAESPSIPDNISAGGLFRLDPTTYTYVPYMAESYTVSADKLTWTAKLRAGMKWSDGKPITADDWVTTAKIHEDEKVGSNYYDSFQINGKTVVVSRVDARTVRIKFPSVVADAIEKASFSPWPAHVFGPVYASKGAAGIKAMWTLSTPVSQIVSSGPFRLAGYRVAERVTYKRNPYFGEWNKNSAGQPLPYLDTYSETIVKDQNAALAQFLAGQLDTFGPRNTDDLAQIKKAVDGGQLKAVLKPNVSGSASSSYIVFNMNRKADPFKQSLFRNEVFRRAMSHLANRQAMVDLALGGLGQPAYSSVYAVFKDWLSPSVKKYDYNPEEAARLLASIGFDQKNSDGYLVNADGKVLEFNLSTNAGSTVREQLAKIFVDEAKKVGVKVDYKPIDFNSLVGQLDEEGDDRDFDAILLGLNGGGVLYPFGDNTVPCGGRLHDFNRSGKCLFDWESQIEKLFYKGAAETSVAARKKIGYQIQDLESLYQPFVYLVSPNAHFAYSSRVHGEFPQGVGNAYVGSRDLALTWVQP
jgi:peptide/nickel transport system substrate-binding protein